jgi:hypothetical protein
MVIGQEQKLSKTNWYEKGRNYSIFDYWQVNNTYRQSYKGVYEKHEIYETLAFTARGEMLKTISPDSIENSIKNLERLKTELTQSWATFISSPKAKIEYRWKTDELLLDIETTMSMYILVSIQNTLEHILKNQRKLEKIIEEAEKPKQYQI